MLPIKLPTFRKTFLQIVEEIKDNNHIWYPKTYNFSNWKNMVYT